MPDVLEQTTVLGRLIKNPVILCLIILTIAFSLLEDSGFSENNLPIPQMETSSSPKDDYTLLEEAKKDVSKMNNLEHRSAVQRAAQGGDTNAYNLLLDWVKANPKAMTMGDFLALLNPKTSTFFQEYFAYNSVEDANTHLFTEFVRVHDGAITSIPGNIVNYSHETQKEVIGLIERIFGNASQIYLAFRAMHDEYNKYMIYYIAYNDIKIKEYTKYKRKKQALKDLKKLKDEEPSIRIDGHNWSDYKIKRVPGKYKKPDTTPDKRRGIRTKTPDLKGYRIRIEDPSAPKSGINPRKSKRLYADKAEADHRVKQLSEQNPNFDYSPEPEY